MSININENSNFIATGYFNQNTDKTAFNSFSPNGTIITSQTEYSTYRTCLSTIPDITKPLAVSSSSTNNGKTIYTWGAGNSLIKQPTNDINIGSYAISLKQIENSIESIQESYIHVKKSRYNSTNNNYTSISTQNNTNFIDEFLYVTGNSTSDRTNTKLPFKSCISLISTPYNTNTGKKWGDGNITNTKIASSLIIKNKLSTAKNLSFNMYLTSTNNYYNDNLYYNSIGENINSSVNPYSIGLLINGASNLTVLNTPSPSTNTFTTSDNNTLIANGSSLIKCNVTIDAGSTCEIVLYKSKLYASSAKKDITILDKSVLFIDLEGLLFETPILTVSSNKTEFYYGNESEMILTCKFTPSNINADTILDQWVKLNLSNYSGTQIFYSQIKGVTNNGVSEYIATFNGFSNDLLNVGTCNISVSYDPNDNYNINKTNNSSVYPYSDSHYLSGSSNSIQITIKKQPITITYNDSNKIYSFINQILFNDFTIVNNYSHVLASKPINSTDLTDLPFEFNFYIYEKSTNILVHSILNVKSFNKFSFIPSDIIKFKTDTEYYFKVETIPDNKNIENGLSNEYYFSTDQLIINYIGTNSQSYSFLNNILLNDFEIKSNAPNSTALAVKPISNTDESNIPFNITLKVYKLNSSEPIFTINSIQTLNKLKFNPSEIFTILNGNRIYNFDVNTEYEFNAYVESTVSNKYKATTEKYKFTTLPLIINNSIIEEYPGYDETIELKLKLYDNSNSSAFYKALILPGTCTFTINTPTPIILTGTYNGDTNSEYVSTFSLVNLNLLRYSQTNYEIECKFTTVNNYIVSNTLNFNFLGVYLISSFDNNSVHSYQNVKITSSLIDRNYEHRQQLTNSQITNIKISEPTSLGSINYKIPTQTNNDSNYTELENNSFIKNFIPYNFNLNHSNSPVNILVKFSPVDSQINTIYENSLILIINLITPMLDCDIIEFNELYYEQTISVKINGIEGHNDFGTLTIYGKNSTGLITNLIKSVENVQLNKSSWTLIDTVSIFELLPSDQIYGLTENASIYGKIEWVPNNENIYSTITKDFTVKLKKTTVNFESINITNNDCPFTQKINVEGKVKTTNGENINGKVEIYIKNSNVKLGEYSLVNNGFTIDIETTVVAQYELDIKFIPTYSNLYLPVTDDTKTINFIKLILNPVIEIYDKNNIQFNKTNGNYDISYIDDFKIKVSQLSRIPNANVIFTLNNNSNKLFTIENCEINSSGEYESNLFNMININKTNKFNILTFLSELSIEISSSSYDNSLYTVTTPLTKIMFLRNNINPSFLSTDFYDINNNKITILDYISDYYIKSTFQDIKNNNDFTNFTGKLKILYENTTSDILQDEITIENHADLIQQLYIFTPKKLNLNIGSYKIKFQIEPFDTNLHIIESNEIRIQIIKVLPPPIDLSLNSLSYSESNKSRPTKYGEKFGATITFTNPGLDGIFSVYCLNPNNTSPSVNDQLLTTATISSKSNDSNYKEDKKQVEYKNLVCNPIEYDTNGETNFIIYVKFNSTNNNFDDNQYVNVNDWRYSVVKNDVLCNNIYIDGIEINNNNNYIIKQINDKLTITGKILINTDEITPKSIVNSGNIGIKNLYGDNSTEYILLSGSNDNTPVNSNGEFTLEVNLNTSCKLYSSSNKSISLIYSNDKNYNNIIFEVINDNVPGILELVINNKIAQISIELEDSPITSLKEYYYQEDILVLNLTVSEQFDNFLNSDSNNNIIRPEMKIYIKPQFSAFEVVHFTVQLTKGSNGYCVGRLVINPKTANIIPSVEIPYIISADFSYFGYDTSNSNIIGFKVLKTIPVISLQFTNSNNAEINSIDYEQSVNIKVNVQTNYPIQSEVTQSRDINGIITLRNFSNNGYLMKYTRMKQSELEPNSQSIIFDSDPNNYNTFSTTGVTITYYPKNNSADKIVGYNGIFAIFNVNSTLYDNNVNNVTYSKPFVITKYSPTLSTSQIISNPDIPHNESMNVYSVNSNFNNFINYDEQIKVTCILNKNINGTLEFYYSPNANSDFTQIIPTNNQIVTGNVTDINNNTTISAFFDRQLIRVQNSSYYWKTKFVPDNTINEFYNQIFSNIIAFNIYESNTFGQSDMYYDNLSSNSISKTISYNSNENYNIAIQFNFVTTLVPSEKQVCKVELYWDDYIESNKITLIPEVILTGTNNNTVLQLSKILLPYRDTLYTIKALFIPLEIESNTTTYRRNNDYPVILERNPLTLIIKPYLTIGNPSTNQTYEYSKPITYEITLNSGTSTVNPYNKFVITTENDSRTNNNTLYRTRERILTLSGSNINQTIEINDFEQLMYGPKVSVDRIDDSLIPGDYKVTIYATNATNDIRTDEIVRYFSIIQNPITISICPNDYYIEYMETIIYTIDSGRYPINNGTLVLTHTNIADSLTHNKTILYTDLIPNPNPNPNTNYIYTYELTNIIDPIKSGSHIISVKLVNQNYTGSYTNEISAQIINKNTKCSIIVNESLYTTRYAYNNFMDEIELSARVVNNADVINNITNGNMYALVNSSTTPLPMVYNELAYIAKINAHDLNKGQNSVILYFVHSEHSSMPSIFQINVGKETKNSSNFVLEQIINSTDPDYFSLKFSTGNVDNQTVKFYKTTKIEQIIPISYINNVYKFNYSDINIGSNEIYAVIQTTNYDITSNPINISKNKRNADITWSNGISELATNYKSGTEINIEYIVTDSFNKNLITEGIIEFHKVIYQEQKINDLIIGYDFVDNYGKGKIIGYKLSPTLNSTFIRFYAIFKKSPNFANVTSKESVEIIVNEKSDFIIIDNTNIPNANNLKLGDNIQFNYKLVTSINNNNKITPGNSEITNADTTLTNANTQLSTAKNTKKLAEDILIQAKTNTINAETDTNKQTVYSNAIINYTNSKSVYENALAAFIEAKKNYQTCLLNSNAATIVKDKYNFNQQIKLDIENLITLTDGKFDSQQLELNNKISVQSIAQSNMNNAIIDLLAAYNVYYKKVADDTDLKYKQARVNVLNSNNASELSTLQTELNTANSNRVSKPNTTTIDYENLVKIPYNAIINAITDFNNKTIKPYIDEYNEKSAIKEIYEQIQLAKQKMDQIYIISLEILNLIEDKEQNYEICKSNSLNKQLEIDQLNTNFETSIDSFEELINQHNSDILLGPFTSYCVKARISDQVTNEKLALNTAIENISNGELKNIAGQIYTLFDARIASISKTNELNTLINNFKLNITPNSDLATALNNYQNYVIVEYFTLDPAYQIIKNDLDSLITTEQLSSVNEIYTKLNEKITCDNVDQNYNLKLIELEQMINLLESNIKTTFDAFKNILLYEPLSEQYLTTKTNLNTSIAAIINTSLSAAAQNMYSKFDLKLTGEGQLQTILTAESTALAELTTAIASKYTGISADNVNTFKLAETTYINLQNEYNEYPEKYDAQIYNSITTLKENKQASLDSNFTTVQTYLANLVNSFDKTLYDAHIATLLFFETKTIKNKIYSDAQIEKADYEGSLAYYLNLKTTAETLFTTANNNLGYANYQLYSNKITYINAINQDNSLIYLYARDYANALINVINCKNNLSSTESILDNIDLEQSLKAQLEDLILQYKNIVSLNVKHDIDVKQIELNEFVKTIGDVEKRKIIDNYILAIYSKFNADFVLTIENNNLTSKITNTNNNLLISALNTFKNTTETLTNITDVNSALEIFNTSIETWLKELIQLAQTNYINAIKLKTTKEIKFKNASINKHSANKKYNTELENYNTFMAKFASIKLASENADSDYTGKVTSESVINSSIASIIQNINNNKTYYTNNPNVNIENIDTLISTYINSVTNRSNANINYLNKENIYSIANTMRNYTYIKCNGDNLQNIVGTVNELTNLNNQINLLGVNSYTEHTTKINILNNKYTDFANSLDPVFLAYTKKNSYYVELQAYNYLKTALNAEKLSMSESVENIMRSLIETNTDQAQDQLITIPGTSTQFNDYLTKENDMRILGDNYYDSFIVFQNATIQMDDINLKLSDLNNKIQLLTALFINANVNASKYALDSAIVEGNIEFHKTIGNIDEIIGYAKPSINGIVLFNYKLVNYSFNNNGLNIKFYGKFTDSINYQDKLTPDIQVTIYKQYQTIMLDLTELNTTDKYKIKDKVNLSYKVTDINNNPIPINEGYVEFHKTIGIIDEIIFTDKTDSSGIISFEYTLVDVSENVSFYGKFVNSQNYSDNTTKENEKNVPTIERYLTEITNNNPLNENIYKVGNEITFNYTVKYNKNIANNYNLPVYQGEIEFHMITTNSNSNFEYDEIIGYNNINNEGKATLTYTLTNIGENKFYVVYKNSLDFATATTISNTNTIDVVDKYETEIIPTSIDDQYYSGSIIDLSCQIINTTNGSNNINEGYIEFYKIITIDEKYNEFLLGSEQVTNGNATLSHTIFKINNSEIVDNIEFYFKYTQSQNYGNLESSKISTQISKKATKINYTFIPINNHIYKIGDTIDLQFEVCYNNNGPISESITEGIIEIYQQVNLSNIDIILGQFVVNSEGKVKLENFKLTEEGTNYFYAKFINSNEFTSVSTINDKIKINVIDKYDVLVEPLFIIPNNIKLGTTIRLEYSVKTNNTEDFNALNTLNAVPVTEQGVEIHKLFNGLDEIIEYIPLNLDGIVSLDYKIINTGNIKFYAIYKNSINYKEKPSVYTTINNIPLQYTPTIVLDSGLITNNHVYILGDEINIKYNVTDNNNGNINEGFINFYKLNIVTNTTELIGHSSVVTGVASIFYKLVDVNTNSTPVDIKIYGKFINSINFADKTSEVITITIQQYLNTTSTLTIDNTSPNYGDTIRLTAAIVSVNNEIINTGFVNFYSNINSNEELIGMSYINNGVTMFDYIINDLPNVTFRYEYINSSRYNNSDSNSVVVNVSKRNIQSINLTVGNVTNYLDTVTINANIVYDKTNCSSNNGTITFKIENNGISKYLTTDVNNNSSSIKIQLENTSNYNVSATYNGNDYYLSKDTTSDTIIIPSINTSVYKSFKYSLTNINATDYVNVNATLNLNDNISNATILKNFGYCIFNQKYNGTIINTYNVQLRNGTANCIMRNNNGYTIEVNYKDLLVDTANITITGIVI